MQTFTREAPKAVANYADSQTAALTKQLNQETDSSKQAALQAELNNWKEDGAYRVALHIATGAIAGGLEGAIGAGAVAAAAPMLTDFQNSVVDKLKAAGANETVAKGAAQIIATSAAAAVGAATTGGSARGAAIGMGVDANNRQLHRIETQWIEKNAKRFAEQLKISESDAEQRLGKQAYRQVQDGAAGAWDPQAYEFLKQSHGMLAVDGSNPLGYLFQATAAQKADAGMYANYLPETAAFYIKNGIRIPSAPEIAIATQRSNTIRDTAGALTKLAAVASGATALVGLSPSLLTWALNHPAEATTLGVITAKTAAAIQSGAITPTLVMEAGVVKAGATGTKTVSAGLEKVTADVGLARKTIAIDSNGKALIGDWSSTKTLSATENAAIHWSKHANEFPEYLNASQYTKGAQKFVTSPPANVLTKIRSNGDTLFYDQATNIFAIKTSSGVPRTMFKPADGINYWNRQ